MSRIILTSLGVLGVAAIGAAGFFYLQKPRPGLTSLASQAAVLPDDPNEFVDPPLVLMNWRGVPLKMHRGDGYGVVLVYLEPTPEKPAGEGPRYILAVEKTRTLIDTEDSAVFAAALKQWVPAGSTVVPYGVCSMPTYYHIKPEDYDHWLQMFRDAGLTLAEEGRTTCTCPVPGS